jgi:hypothetical protein
MFAGTLSREFAKYDALKLIDEYLCKLFCDSPIKIEHQEKAGYN